MSRFIKAVKEETNYTLTENLAVTHKSSLSDVVDLFAVCGASRTKTEVEIEGMFLSAMREDPLLATRCLFYCRDIRGGQGERRTPRIMMKALANHYPDIMRKNLQHVPFFGRWDDIFQLFGTPLEADVITMIGTALHNNDALLAKWMPSENTASRKTRTLAKFIRTKLGLTPKVYRKTLVRLRKVVEKQMCAKDWENIKYEHVPSHAMKNYRKAFGRHDQDRFALFLTKVEKGEAKIHSAALFPYDLARIALQGDDKTIDLQWKSLPNYVKEGENAIVVADVSGSMGSLSGDRRNPAPVYISVSLAIYFAERNIGPFNNHFITFTRIPELQTIRGNTLHEKVMSVLGERVAENTDFQAVFDLILSTAKKHNLSQEELPKKVYVISDMEFDMAEDGWGGRRSTNFQVIERKYTEAGYAMPTLIFWNVDARNEQQPVTIKDKNTCLVSGSSPSLFANLLGGKDFTPEAIMRDVLNSERYTVITV